VDLTLADRRVGDGGRRERLDLHVVAPVLERLGVRLGDDVVLGEALVGDDDRRLVLVGVGGVTAAAGGDETNDAGGEADDHLAFANH